jgi:hypothetical protein
MQIGKYVTVTDDFKSINVYTHIVPFEEMEELIAVLESIQFIKHTDPAGFDLNNLYYTGDEMWIQRKSSTNSVEYVQVYDRDLPQSTYDVCLDIGEHKIIPIFH